MSTASSIPPHVTITTKHITELTQEVCVLFSLTKKDFIYKDFISFSVAHPAVHISPWKTNSSSLLYYDPFFKNNKNIFKKNVCILFTISAESPINESVPFYCTYYQRSEKKINQFAYELSFADNQDITTNSQLIHTLLDIDNKREKIKYSHVLPFNVHLTNLFMMIQHYVNSLIIPPTIHVLCIAFLIFLCLFLTYFLNQQTLIHTPFTESITLMTATSYFFFIGYIVYNAYIFITPYIMTPLTTIVVFGIGVFYIKKSTDFQWKYLCALCSICGGMCIIATVPFLCKAIQIIFLF